jgi:hypothetical protein
MLNQPQISSISWTTIIGLFLLFARIAFVAGQQQCYFGPGAVNRGPANLVPCNSTGTSTCCLLGDTCLSGNTCYNYATGDLYQYGCTDIEYKDVTCPYKCGFDPGKKLEIFIVVLLRMLTRNSIVTMDSARILHKYSRSFQYVGMPRSRKLRLFVEVHL